MPFGTIGDMGRFPVVNMSDPRAPQRREPPSKTMVPIPRRFFGMFPIRETRGDRKPIYGHIQFLSDGMPGGRPVPPPRGNMFPVAHFPMGRQPINEAKRAKTFAEREVAALRYQRKGHITMAVTDKSAGLDMARSLRMRPGVEFGIVKPRPPAPYTGGYTRVMPTDRNYPMNTAIEMRPIQPVGVAWGPRVPPPGFSRVSVSRAARFPTLS